MSEVRSTRIRPATPRDLLAMEWEGEYRRYRRLYQQAMAEALRGRCSILLADAGGLVVGQVVVRFGTAPPQVGDAPDVGYLHAVRVRPAFRNRGIGTQLIMEAEALLRCRGFCRAALAVARDNPDARRLYERLGYAVIAEDPGDWSYLDDEGHWRQVHEPCHILEKVL